MNRRFQIFVFVGGMRKIARVPNHPNGPSSFPQLFLSLWVRMCPCSWGRWVLKKALVGGPGPDPTRTHWWGLVPAPGYWADFVRLSFLLHVHSPLFHPHSMYQALGLREGIRQANPYPHGVCLLVREIHPEHVNQSFQVVLSNMGKKRNGRNRLVYCGVVRR